jgi:hypothetical protein
MSDKKIRVVVTTQRMEIAVALVEALREKK